MKKFVCSLACILVHVCSGTRANHLRSSPALLPKSATTSLANNVRNPVTLYGSSASAMQAEEALASAIDQLNSTRVFASSGTKRSPHTQTVWVVGFGRSGSTLLQQLLVTAAVGHGQSVFAAFEPCHIQDVFKGVKVGPSLAAGATCMKEVINCDFSHIQMKHFQSTQLFSQYGGTSVNRGTLTSTCKSSSVRIFKTIFPTPASLAMLSKYVDLSGVQVIQLSRDPRSIYSSAVSNFRAQLAALYSPQRICSTQLVWVNERTNTRLTKEGRLLPMNFEDLVLKPEREIPRILSFLKWDNSRSLDIFTHTHMSTSDCGTLNKRRSYTFGTCRTLQDTLQILTKWKNNLSPVQKGFFNTQTCQRAISIYGYIG